jgi:hypothetical protein
VENLEQDKLKRNRQHGFPSRNAIVLSLLKLLSKAGREKGRNHVSSEGSYFNSPAKQFQL